MAARAIGVAAAFAWFAVMYISISSIASASSGVPTRGHAVAQPHSLLEHPLPPLRATQSSRCARARAIADKLGETFAGHRVRETLVARSCAFALHERSGPNALWDWPWRLVSEHYEARETNVAPTADVNHLLPPFALRDAGQWQIRCGRTELRQRCALLRIEPVAIGILATNSIAIERETPPIIAHAVIDTVAGRTTVLFRVFLPRTATNKRATSQPQLISVGLGSRTLSLPVNRCGPLGCILEADTTAGAAIVHHLWDGHPLALTIHLGHGQTEAIIPALGFRDGIQGLVGLEYLEGRRALAR